MDSQIQLPQISIFISLLNMLNKLVSKQSHIKKGLSLANRNFTTTTTQGSQEPLKKTHLYAYHKEVLKGKMVSFAGYEMPVLYNEGIIKEHLHCREHAGIFDVSHMGQVQISGSDAQDFLQYVTVADLQSLRVGHATLSLLMNEKGGIKDDCIITKVSDKSFFVVLNAGCKYKDLNHLNEYRVNGDWKEKDIKIQYNEDENSLIAIQGPKAAKLVEDIMGTSLADMGFMQSELMTANKFNDQFRVSRCGYTGEDGFELSIPHKSVLPFVEMLTSKKENGVQLAKFVGLGARDTLRLEAGLCLYGHELTEEISPIEATLGWTISKRRKQEGGFLGFETIKKHVKEGVSKKRSGFIVEGPPAREGVEITNKDGLTVGVVTSGTHSPSLKKSIGQAYIDLPYNKTGTELFVSLRGKNYPIKVAKMPFVPSRYYKKE